MSLDAQELRTVFEHSRAYTVGLEEEVMLLSPRTLELAECAPALLERLDGDPRFKLELPAAQLELVTPARDDVGAAIDDLAAARRELVAAAGTFVRPAAAGAHPFSPDEGRLNDGARYEHTAREYASVARRQLVCALQVHVAVGGADRALAVYNALREYLPELAALAANAPFHRGRDTGLASIRPKIAENLPRQGVPPVLSGWEDYAEQLRWGLAAGSVPHVGAWWWELRPNPLFGTLELRVPDAQSTLSDAAAVAALAHALVIWLAERHEAGELGSSPPTWRIEENRWAACRYGVEGALADLHTGEPRPTRERLHELVELVEPAADRAGCARELARTRALIERNGAIRQRAAASGRGGPHAVARWLADRYADRLD